MIEQQTNNRSNESETCDGYIIWQLQYSTGVVFVQYFVVQYLLTAVQFSELK